VSKTDATVGRVLDVVRAAATGEALIDTNVLPRLVHQLQAERSRSREVQAALGRLTAREQEVLCLLTQGMRNDAMADALSISVQTVTTHVQRILSKLGVHSRLEAVALAARSPADGRAR
jgi:DNA-binding NarL/FixJ family response regulator